MNATLTSPAVVLMYSLFTILGVLHSTALLAAEKPSGEAIYQNLCAKCHGAKGEGAKAYPEPLLGDKSVLELTRLIEKTMPENDPKLCVGDDAHAVAAYIYDAFYSPTAQVRNRPPRIELSRLTVRQYRNSLADLIATDQGAPVWPKERGLRAEYFKNGHYNDRVLERVDPQVTFDFAEKGPLPEKIDPKTFSMRWTGAVLAPDTGEYEFTVHTNQATRLWINDDTTPLVDAYVKSGDNVDHKGTLFLLGGRVYPLRLEFAKANQGVKDDKHPPAKNAFITLQWKRPHLPMEPIDERYLSPKWTPAVFVSSTPFPPDDRSMGYERGTAVNKAWDQATTDGAIETASYVVEHLEALSRSKSDDPKRAEKVREYATRFVERAFRRPLTPEITKLYVERPFTEAENNLEAAVKRVVLLALKSPRFLFLNAADHAPEYAAAEKLSYTLWDSFPDAALMQAAKQGKLTKREEARAHAERMMSDVRTHSKLREYFLQWLKVDQVPDLSKNPQRYGEFDETLAADLRTSLEIFLDDVVWSEDSDFRRLLLADQLPLNGRLSKFYGAGDTAQDKFQAAALNPQHRAGVLTHPYLLASFAYSESSSPIHRGVFVSRSLLGRALKSPPIAVAPAAASLQPDLTTRERVAQQTSANVCMSCHAMINPLGFTLENFDAVGRFRAEEQGKPIDASGSYLTRTGDEVNFHGVRELAKFLAESEETQTAFVEQLYHYLVKQPIRAYSPQQSPELVNSFQKNAFHIRRLVAEIAVRSAFPAE
jgi:Protein of unknown function (DUF1592)/Protein of unknown function (DUF1588)/PA14 domain/Protein of unknown function (DUF1595)/Cytochrome C oxidase, cbb3-type, subunit III